MSDSLTATPVKTDEADSMGLGMFGGARGACVTVELEMRR